MMQISSPLLWKKQFEFGYREIGILFSFIGLCTVMIQGLFMQWVLKFFNEKWLIILGSVLMLGGLIAMPIIPKELFFPYGLAAIFIIAVSNAFIIAPVNSLISAETPTSRQGVTLGALYSLGSLGRTFGPLFSGALYTFYYTLPFHIAAVFMLICLVFFMVRMKLYRVEN